MILDIPVFAGDRGVPAEMPPAEFSPTFRDVRDRTPIVFRETAAYSELLRRTREDPPAELESRARRDILYTDLVNNPARFRGLPIRVQGTARLIHPLLDVPKPLSLKGKLYEAWVFTSDGRGYPMVLVFEDPPIGLPMGDDVEALVVFHGYFFKLLAYRAGDRPRFAPLLVGRLGYEPHRASIDGSIDPGSRNLWIAAPVAMLGAYALLRLILVWQRGLFPSARPRRFGDRPTDKISPEDLDAWLRSEEQEDFDEGRGGKPGDGPSGLNP